MSQSWYYRTLGIQCGPISRDALMEMVRCGRLGEGTEVRSGDSTIWMRAGDLIAHERPEASADDLESMLALDEPASQGPSDLPNIDDITFGTSEIPESARQPQSRPRWICRVRGRQLGPVEFDVMAELARAGVLSKTDRVRPEDEPKWVLAESVEGLEFSRDSEQPGQHAAPGNVAPQRLSIAAARTPGVNETRAQTKSPGATPPTVDPQPPQGELTVKLPKPSECGAVPSEARPRPDLRPAASATSPAQDRHHLSAAQPRATTPPRPFTPPAAYAASSRPAAYARPAFSPPRPSRSSSFSMDELMGQPAIKYALMAAVGIVVLGLGYWQFGASIGIRKGDRYYYDLAQGMYFAAKQAEDPNVLKTMGKQLTPVIEEIKAGTQTRAKMGDEVAQMLLQCSQEYFPKLFGGDPKERAKNLQPIEAALKKAQQALEG